MPEPPRWRRRNSSICRRGWSFGAKASFRFGRSKEWTTLMRRLREKLLGDVLARLPVGGGGQRRDRHAAQRLARLGEQAVFGPEIMAPLRDAMGLVDGEPGHAEPAQPRRPAPRPPAARARRRAGADRRRSACPRPRRPQLSLFIEFSEAAATPARVNCPTWSRISAISGETTSVSPPATSAGSW